MRHLLPLWALFFSFSLWGLGPESIGEVRMLSEGLFYSVNDFSDEWITADRNNDGLPDYAMAVDERNQKTFEAIDFNYDGFMDDFYVYSADVLVRREIDQNFDEQVDLWVYLREGVYVEGYERDTSGDGRIDTFKLYGQ
ncbi:MAG: hypothetical protein GW949_06740 [Spirochaetales bacterium]|nr:hypothetical protein [Spirochaetales bacterium]